MDFDFYEDYYLFDKDLQLTDSQKENLNQKIYIILLCYLFFIIMIMFCLYFYNDLQSFFKITYRKLYIRYKIKYTNNYNPFDKCSICLDNFNHECIIKLKCNHLFHQNCIHKWFRINIRCPLCRNT